MKISGVYQIINTITGDCYIGSSIDLKKREKEHFSESVWKYNQNKPLYKDMQQYGKDNFLFKPIQLCNPKELKKYEQIAIKKYNPKYNIRDAYTGMSKEEYNKQYRKEHADSIKQYNKEHADSIKQYKKQYNKEHADSIKQQQKQYRKEHADSIKQQQKQYRKEHADSIKQYRNQQCLYENEMLSLNALSNRFSRQGIEHPTLEAKKYLIDMQE